MNRGVGATLPSTMQKKDRVIRPFAFRHIDKISRTIDLASDELPHLPLIITQTAPRLYNLVFKACPGGGMVDAADLKSVDRKVVRVRVPPWAPVL